MAHTPNETVQSQRMTAKTVFPEEMYDFSLVLGDPLFQFFRKARLSGDHLELLHRRLIAITSIAWVPLLLLDSLGSQATSTGRLSFLHDVEVQVRFLVALPVLIGGRIDCSFAHTPSCAAICRTGIGKGTRPAAL
jgi:hypothetical protein